MRLLPLVLVLIACTGPKKDGRDKYGRTEADAARYAAAVERRDPLLGMHQDEVRNIIMGAPEKVSRQARADTTYTVWEYRSRSLDFFFDKQGFLMHWQAPY
ncbi:MAG: hypothetical protein ACYS0F_13375 [Planctomycetota bacterium]|jgi:hypothetical protein